jgi:uncharacterized membrane protein
MFLRRIWQRTGSEQCISHRSPATNCQNGINRKHLGFLPSLRIAQNVVKNCHAISQIVWANTLGMCTQLFGLQL